MTGPTLVIDLAAIAANTRLFADLIRNERPLVEVRAQRALEPGRLMAVVKADGFGHGGVAVARTALANGASWLGVTTVDEASALRRDGITAPVLSWLNQVDADFGAAVVQHIDLAVPSSAHLQAIAAAAARVGRPADIHLHLDVGMARDGAEPATWSTVCEAAYTLECRGLVRVVAIMGHLGWADDPADPFNAMARASFAAASATARRQGLRPRMRHLAATSATLTDRRTHLDLCRIGAGLVGIDPSRTTRLSPAMTLTAPVVGIREVARGTSVGYGHTYMTERRTRLALLPVGYADGVPRAASGRASVLVRGRRRPLAGVVSMDQVVVDVGDDSIEVGDVATVFGPGEHGEPTVAEWAAWAGTIEHEIVTGIGARVVRRVLPADAAPALLVSAGAGAGAAR